MKKLFLLLSVAALFFSACNKNNPSDPTPTPKSDPVGHVEILFRVDDNTAPHVKLNVLKGGNVVKTLTSTDSTYKEESIKLDTPITYTTEFVYDTDWNNEKSCNVGIYLVPKIVVYDESSDIAVDTAVRGTTLKGVMVGRIQDAMKSFSGFLDKSWTLSKTGIKR